MKKQRPDPVERAKGLLEASLLVPRNWTDPLLTGAENVVGARPDCQMIEMLLNAIRQRILLAGKAAMDLAETHRVVKPKPRRKAKGRKAK